MISDIKFLDSIDVAAPCSASWESMTGGDRVRFCQDCSKNVYNLSDMTRKEAEALVRENGEGRLCIRFYRRADGTVLTDNCPVGLRAMRNAIVNRWAVMVSLAAALFHLPGHAASASTPPKPIQTFTRLGMIRVTAPPVSPAQKTKQKTVVPHHTMGRPAVKPGLDKQINRK
jgi:hypothetical protein